MQFSKPGMSKFSSQGKSVRKHKHSKVMGLLHISHVAEIHAIHKPWVNFLTTEQVWENTGNSQILLYLTYLELMQSSVSGNVQIHITWNYSVESNIIPRL